PGARAPHLVERDDLALMKPGAVIIDVAIDQGGCIATSRPTSHAEPTFVIDEVVHYCVTNMPGAVGRTSTHALCNATLPYVLQVAEQGVIAAAKSSEAIASAVNVLSGELLSSAVAAAFGMKCAAHPFS
ncbi:MAG: alanine dehydrogenase, partial [Pirellulales bacterium]